MTESFETYGRLSRRFALYQAFLLIVGIGAFNEILEWLLAVAMSPGAAEAYNGQQGDLFDAPKDMATAALGGVLSSGLLYPRRLKKAA